MSIFDSHNRPIRWGDRVRFQVSVGDLILAGDEFVVRPAGPRSKPTAGGIIVDDDLARDLEIVETGGVRIRP